MGCCGRSTFKKRLKKVKPPETRALIEIPDDELSPRMLRKKHRKIRINDRNERMRRRNERIIRRKAKNERKAIQ